MKSVTYVYGLDVKRCRMYLFSCHFTLNFVLTLEAVSYEGYNFRPLENGFIYIFFHCGTCPFNILKHGFINLQPPRRHWINDQYGDITSVLVRIGEFLKIT